jgi:hypothetical protein
MEDLENKYNAKKKEFDECNVELEVSYSITISHTRSHTPQNLHHANFNNRLIHVPQKVKKSIRELQTKEKELTERRGKCEDATRKLRTGLRIFKVRDTLLKMGDEGDQTRREIVEAERLQFVKDIADDKKSLNMFLAEQRVRVPNLSHFSFLLFLSRSLSSSIQLALFSLQPLNFHNFSWKQPEIHPPSPPSTPQESAWRQPLKT